MTTVGTISLIATIDTSRYKKGAAEIDDANKDIEKSAGKTESTANSSMTRVAKVGLAAVATAAIAAGAAIATNIGSAIKRVDTLNNSTRVFENMGFQTVDVSKAMRNLEESITGLPTPLDAAVRGMTSLAATYGDVGAGQRIFSALNNAIIGFGGTAAEVDSAIQQLSQLPMDGPLDAQTWNSLRNSGLTPVLVAIAKDMGVGINEMKEAFGSGQLTVKDFTDALVKMDKDGGGGMQSLQKIAKDSTSGIGTSFENMNTAITRGIGNIIKAVGNENISNAITNLGKAFEAALNSVVGLVQFIQNNGKVFETLGIVIGSILVPAVLRYTVATTIAGVQSVLAGARMAAAWLAALGPIGIITIAVTAVTGLIVANFDSVRNVVLGVWSSITVAAINTWNSITRAFQNVGGWFTDRFNAARDGIMRAFGGLGGFFQGVWNNIVGIFGNVGTAVGNAIGGAFRNVINSIIGRAASIINGFIDSINFAIGVINNIPGVNIGTLGRLNVPQLASGGIITSPTLAMVGEGNEPEAVIPLSKLDAILERERGGTTNSNANITINMTGIMARSRADLRDIGKDIIRAVNQELVTQGKPAIGGIK